MREKILFEKEKKVEEKIKRPKKSNKISPEKRENAAREKRSFKCKRKIQSTAEPSINLIKIICFNHYVY